MAAANIAFKMPQEPCPLPSLESDEESFVVLGRSIPDCGNDEYGDLVGLSVVDEAKRLLNLELEALDQGKNLDEKKEDADVNKVVSIEDQPKMMSSTVLPSMPDIEKSFDSTTTISIAHFSSDMSSEEVQNKISQIIDENISLKDTVLQNNMTLKSQYEKIVAWRDEVEKVHMTHKEKLLEAKNFIENLKKEKENMKRDLTKATEVNNNLAAQIVEMKRSLKEKEHASNEVLVQRSDDNIKEFQLDVANKKIKDLEAEVEKLNNENKVLIDKAAVMDVQGEETRKKITDLESYLGNLTLNAKEKEDNLKKVEPELQKLLEERSNSARKIEELKNELLAKCQREEALVMTTNALKAQLEINDQSEELNKLRTQLNDIQTNLTQVEYSRGQAYCQVSQLSQELSMLKAQTSLPDRNDEVCALKVQLDVYKSDFEEERHAREVIKGERDRLDENIQNLQRRNQQLQEEIEMLRVDRDYVVYPRQNSSRPQSNRGTVPVASAPAPADRPTFKCPKCDFGFSNITQLESHVHRCLELDDQLP